MHKAETVFNITNFIKLFANLYFEEHKSTHDLWGHSQITQHILGWVRVSSFGATEFGPNLFMTS